MPLLAWVSAGQSRGASQHLKLTDTTGCRLPGDVKSASDFWDLMMSKSTGNTPKVPSSRFNIDSHIHANNDRPGSFGVLGGYFLHDDLADFDPGLFGITPVEAMWMDPQQRKLLEVVYECLESGGICLDKIAGTNTAVFAASFTADWQQMAFKENSFRHSLAATGVDPGIISNRISHVFNLTGPSILCNTACSSSVYALHNACNALRNNETEGKKGRLFSCHYQGFANALFHSCNRWWRKPHYYS